MAAKPKEGVCVCVCVCVFVCMHVYAWACVCVHAMHTHSVCVCVYGHVQVQQYYVTLFCILISYSGSWQQNVCEHEIYMLAKILYTAHRLGGI